MRDQGLGLETIAAQVNCSIPELEQRFKEYQEGTDGMLKAYQRHFVKRCQHCGGEIPDNLKYMETGVYSYHTHCWRKLSFG